MFTLGQWRERVTGRGSQSLSNETIYFYCALQILSLSLSQYLCLLQFTQVDEYAREPYSKMGQDLIGAIATVHPFTLSTLLERAVEALDNIGEVREVSM